LANFRFITFAENAGVSRLGNKMDTFTITAKDREIKKNLLLMFRLPPFKLSVKDQEILS
jgi:hypothetical protein